MMNEAVDLTCYILKFCYIVVKFVVKNLSKILEGFYKCVSYGSYSNLISMIIILIILIVNAYCSKSVGVEDGIILLTFLLLVIDWCKLSKYSLENLSFIEKAVIKLMKDNKKIKKELKKKNKKEKIEEIIIDDNEPKKFKDYKPIIELNQKDYKVIEEVYTNEDNEL